MKKLILIAIFFAFVNSVCSQVQKKQKAKKEKWQFGIGGALVKFGDKHVEYIGDRFLFQVPRFNLSAPIGNKWSFDGALSFNTLKDAGFVSNSVWYFSMDGSFRYNFYEVSKNFHPYVFTGGSWVDSERKMTPTLNFGAGATYWVGDNFGFNSQLYYKHSFEGYESMRSHIQITASVIFGINWNRLFSGGKARSTNCYYDLIE